MRTSHRHDELEMNLIVSGRAKLLFTDRCYELLPGAMAWMFPKQEHLLWEESDDFEMWIACFSARLVKQTGVTKYYRPLVIGDPPGHFCRVITAEKRKYLTAIMQKALKAVDDRVLVRASLGYLLPLAWEAFESATLYAANLAITPAVKDALLLMNSDDSDMGLEEVAEKVGVSASHLSRAFKKDTGVGFAEFRNRLRVDRFMNEFSSAGDKCNLLRAAMSAGFGSYAQFYRVFTKYTGMTPREFLRRR